MARLGDVCDVFAGQGAPQGAHNYCDSKNGTPFIKAGDLSDLLSGKSECEIQCVTDAVARKHKLKLYPAGSILFAKSGMSCMKGYVYRVQNPSYVVSHLAILVPQKVDGEYLKFYLEYHKPNSLIKDSAYPSISLQDISNMELTVPCLEKQKEFANNLHRVNELITCRKQQLSTLDDLVMSRFIEMFGDLASPYCQWETRALIDTCVDKDDIKCGPFGTQLSKNEYQNCGVAVWEIPQINNRFTTKPTHYLTQEKAQQLSAYSIVAGDIAMSRKGNVGKCAIFPADFQDGIIHSDVLRIRVDTSKVLPVFMMYQLHYSQAVQHQIELVSSGAIMAGINVTKLKQILVHIPPIDLQNQFVEFVKQTDKLKFEIKEALEKLETLKKSLMQQYFG